ncbi:hypothetical protein HanPSC8_Chr05g0228871 [Helianthus annuus]|nr:hypothetical protein HanPSC8_Chr05g0228871 [Helianthus annuus]
MVRYGSNLRFCSMFSGRQTGSAQMTARVTIRFRFSQSSSQAGQSGQTWSTAVFSSVKPVNWSTRVTRETWYNIYDTILFLYFVIYTYIYICFFFILNKLEPLHLTFKYILAFDVNVIYIVVTC